MTNPARLRTGRQAARSGGGVSSCRALAAWVCLIGLLLTVGCEKPEPVEELLLTEPPFIATEDLDGIVESGTLRVLLPLLIDQARLPRDGFPLDLERSQAEAYAESLDLEPVFIYVESRAAMIDALIHGRGDLIAANLTATAERRQRVDFTVPLAVVREQIVTRADDSALNGPAQLDGRTVHVRPSSSFWNTVERLAERHPGLKIEPIPETIDMQDAIRRVATGEFDLTVADSNVLENTLGYRDDVRAAFDISGDRPIAWAVRQESPLLLKSLDSFLTDAQLAARDEVVHFDDWEGIGERKVLRMLTRNNAANYFLYRGELLGFEYELMREFAEQNGLQLKVVVPPRQVDLYNWLISGKGDVIAASQVPTPEREALGVQFTRPYNYVSHWVVAPQDYPDVETADELGDAAFFVRRSSTYWMTLRDLRQRGLPIQLHAAPEELETEELIAEVADGRVGLTLADSHILDIELTWRDDIKPLLALEEEIPLAWAVREDNPQLKDALDGFVAEEYRGLFYNITYRKYFRDRLKIRRRQQNRSDLVGRLSPYDELARKYAEQYSFDWRLIVAQMYQESRFDPNARSFAGAEGLLQVLPATAQSLGFETLDDPESMIHAGVRYLDWVRDRFPQDLSVRDRMWFTLAAYNAGVGHVREARRLAAKQGWNRNRWFDNVEKAMLLLQRPQYAAASPYGYCRCSEPVRYVRQIRERYRAYLEAVPAEQRSTRLETTAPSDAAVPQTAGLGTKRRSNG